MIHDTRVRVLRDEPPRRGKYVLYWMQQSQRARFNPALEYAVREANALGLPAVVGFGLMDDYPEANARHYAFMLDGLRDVLLDLKDRGVKFVVRRGSPADVAVGLAADAAVVVCDRGYLRHQKRWRDDVAARAGTRVVEVEGDVVVPVDVASNKQEHAARTLRPKIRKHLPTYLVELPAEPLRRESARMRVAGDIDASDPAAALAALKLDRSVPPSPHFVGGSREGQRRVAAFVAGPLAGYADKRNEPAADRTSHLGAYLHFGQISPVDLALQVSRAAAPQIDRDAYIEELVVRRELSANFVHHCPHYDAYACVPAWARKALAERAADPRPVVYTTAQLEAAQTYDPYWNAAQLEMVKTGFMHNYMRMYWGKKIIEWSPTPEAAYQVTLYLNNKYFLCGRNHNAYGNVAWVFGLHDRPWGPARKVFGTVRYMNDAGLRRKFDMDAYVRRVAAL